MGIEMTDNSETAAWIGAMDAKAAREIANRATVLARIALFISIAAMIVAAMR
jgi:hypothetical protein